jgi:serine/threonine protein phosphatase PrpC
MGTYLSTPVTDKNEESGESPKLAWGVVEMQGWRKTMEDAHVAESPSSARLSPSGIVDDDDPGGHGLGVFGVFDGHGGPEVARFCQLYLVSVLTQQDAWKQHVAEALASSPSSMTKEVVDPALEQENPTTDAPGGRKHPKETGVGQALVAAFHALDRMIDDPDRR